MLIKSSFVTRFSVEVLIGVRSLIFSQHRNEIFNFWLKLQLLNLINCSLVSTDPLLLPVNVESG